MSIKIVNLKSLEDVIANVSEMKSDDKVIGYVLDNPYVLSFNENRDQVGFYPYAPLSKDTSIPIPCDWVVTILEPLDQIKTSYMEKVNAKSEDSDIEE
jgi:hypothetical protein